MARQALLRRNASATIVSDVWRLSLLALVAAAAAVGACGTKEPSSRGQPPSSHSAPFAGNDTRAAVRPVRRGVYRGRVTVGDRACRGCVLLTLSRDARRFVRSSFVGVEARSIGLPCSVAVHLAGPGGGPFGERPVRIDANAGFRYAVATRHRTLTVSGRFSARGRRVTGRLVVEDRTRSCTQEFRARFKGRVASPPRAPAPEPQPACKAVTIESDTVEIHGSDVDCARARDAALRWRDDPACQTLLVGHTCQAAALACTAIERGTTDPSAEAQCSSADVTPIELVAFTECRGRRDLTVGVARLACRDGRDVARSWASSPCTWADKRGDVCYLPRWTCELTKLREGTISVDYVSRCRANADRREAVAINWHTG